MFDVHYPRLRGIAIAAVFSLIVLVLDSMAFFDPIRAVVVRMTLPLQIELVSRSVQIRSAMQGVPHFFSLQQKFDALREDYLRLQAENARLRMLKKENEALFRQLSGRSPGRFRFLPVRIIRTDQELRISGGIRDDIVVGMPIVFGDILIGSVVDVSAHTARVRLTTDPQSSIAVVVDESGQRGIVKGAFGSGLTLTQVLQGSPLEVGQLVLTSGQDDDFPPGLTVGRIERASGRQEDIFQSADLSLLVDVDTLDTVFVVFKE